jgi:hypothetical protein
MLKEPNCYLHEELLLLSETSAAKTLIDVATNSASVP